MSNEAIIFGVITTTFILTVIKPYIRNVILLDNHYKDYLIALYHSNVNYLLTDFECDLYLKNLRNKYYVAIRYLYGDLYFDQCIKDMNLYKCSVGRLKQCANIMKEQPNEELESQGNTNQ
jgi:hypothetical protein